MRPWRRWPTCALALLLATACIDEQPIVRGECVVFTVDGERYCVLGGTRPIHETGFRCVDIEQPGGLECPAEFGACSDSPTGPICGAEPLPPGEAEHIGEAFEDRRPAEGDTPPPIEPPGDDPPPVDDQPPVDDPPADDPPVDDPPADDPPVDDPPPADRLPAEPICPVPELVADRPALTFDPDAPASFLITARGVEVPGEWAWPDGSNEFGPDPRSTLHVTGDGEARLDAHAIGRHIITVSFHAPGCPVESATVEVELRPPPGLFVEVFWQLPYDAEADLDVLLRQDSDSWRPGPNVCDADNPNPEWGPPGGDGDPILVADDTVLGPEHVWVPAPVPGQTYGVGVYADVLPELDEEFHQGQVPVCIWIHAPGFDGWGICTWAEEVDSVIWVADVFICPGEDAGYALECDAVTPRGSIHQGRDDGGEDGM